MSPARSRFHPRWLALLALAGLVACGGSNGGTVAPGGVVSDETTASGERVVARLWASGFDRPWSIALLPDGGALVTEKGGRLWRMDADGRRVGNLSGVPPVVDSGQGGLLDVVIDPDFAREPWVYFSYSEPGSGADAGRAGTALARARLQGQALVDLQVIFRQTPKVSGGNHFGARMAFDRSGALLLSLGERAQDDPSRPGRQYAQDPAKSLGKVVRLQRDGQIPADNPSLAGGVPGLYTLGHRNPQGIAVHPDTGEIWVVEHGPQGGDELNRLRPGANYGWPLKSYGCPYGSPAGTGCRVGGGTHAPDYEEPVATWVPWSTAPSSLLIHDGRGQARWAGHMFIGALAGQRLWHLVVEGGVERRREAWLAGLGARIRDLRQTPGGDIIVLTDDGRVLRLSGA